MNLVILGSWLGSWNPRNVFEMLLRNNREDFLSENEPNIYYGLNDLKRRTAGSLSDVSY
jgi:hypothetical protein